jgi:1,4-alpha-glucan branching enzyme
VPRGGFWKEMLNSDSTVYSGSGQGNAGGMEAEAIPYDGRSYSLSLTLPPLAAMYFKNTGS